LINLLCSAIAFPCGSGPRYYCVLCLFTHGHSLRLLRLRAILIHLTLPHSWSFRILRRFHSSHCNDFPSSSCSSVSQFQFVSISSGLFLSVQSRTLSHADIRNCNTVPHLPPFIVHLLHGIIHVYRFFVVVPRAGLSSLIIGLLSIESDAYKVLKRCGLYSKCTQRPPQK